MASGFEPLFRGVNYVGDVYGSFTYASSLSSLSGYGINAVAITADFGIDALNNTVYQNDVAGGFTESDADITTVVGQAVAQGSLVMVRPLIDFLPPNYNTSPNGTNVLNGSYQAGEFRNDYNPGPAGSAGANAFFASYQAMIVDQAKIAQAKGAGQLCIGAELDQITGPAYESYWDDIITAVRAVFTGKLTYSANWDSGQAYWQYNTSFGTGAEAGAAYITGNLITQISFWSKLDYIGVDEYAPISDVAKPSLQQLIDGWTKAPTDPVTAAVTGGQSLIAYYEGLSAATGKPLLFTEMGYANSSDAAANPAVPGYDVNGNPDGATADPSLQANLYTAFFDAWSQAGNSSLAGTFMWDWEPGGAGISPFSPQGLPAATALAAGYQAVCYLRGTRILTPEGPRPVEELRPGDAVICRFGGVRRLIWSGQQRFARRFIAGNTAQIIAGHTAQIPVRIAAGALGAGLPLRDLSVSPGHSMLLDGVLVLARDLVNGINITQAAPPGETHYIQLDFGTHDCVLAEGVWSESFADGPGLRARFHNVAEFYRLWPDYVAPEQLSLCAPRPESGAALAAALAPVVARAAALRAPGALQGWVEDVHEDGMLHGWARDAASPDLPVALEIWSGPDCLGTALACQRRRDLAEAGLGAAAFIFAVPPGLALPALTVRRTADAQPLSLLPAAQAA